MFVHDWYKNEENTNQLKNLKQRRKKTLLKETTKLERMKLIIIFILVL